MNDNDINEMIKKAQDMINNNQVPKEISDLASQLSKNGNLGNNSSNNNYYSNTSGNNNYSNHNNYNNSANHYNGTSNANKASYSVDNNYTKNGDNGSTIKSNSGNFDVSNIDMNTLLKMQNMLSKLNSSNNDDMSKLLFALKPYLRNEKKEKINEYINLIKMGKIAQLFDIMGGDKH